MSQNPPWRTRRRERPARELTAAGHELHDRAKPVHDRTLERVLAEAAEQPELAPMVDALHSEPAVR